MQTDLFTPSTSRIAREKFISEGKEDAHEKKIIEALIGKELTAYQIGRFTALSSTQVSRRTIKLERMKIIERTGERRKDADDSTRMVYRLITN